MYIAGSWIVALACGSVMTSQEGRASTPAALLDELGTQAFDWFRDHRHPTSGQVLDRGPNRKAPRDRSRMASIAATGYFLTLLPEWVRLERITADEARRQAVRTLDFAAMMPHHHGLFYHFHHWETGRRWDRSEVSTLDSAIFFNGCIVAAQAFGGDVADRANALIDRADWSAFLVTHPRTGKRLLSLGWTPESGLLSPADVRSSEMAMPLFLAIGSTTHAVDPSCWYNTDVVRGEVAGQTILNPSHALFTSYYGLGWHDLKGLVDREGVDLWENARLAALANRAFSRGLAGPFRTYRPDEGGWWGLSAGDAPNADGPGDRYIAVGPVADAAEGTVWPVAALAAIPSIPDVIEADLPRWRASAAWDKAAGPYGLSPFNLDRDWVGPDVIGIDLGSFAVALANHRNRTVWDLWKQHPVAQAALRRLEFAPSK